MILLQNTKKTTHAITPVETQIVAKQLTFMKEKLSSLIETFHNEIASMQLYVKKSMEDGKFILISGVSYK
ncbi:hypothetical protein BFR04_11900 [Gaetbulibacter sp. 4G1]|nr:hypothetical protein [Gaetbulibacter sp. 4G1]PIA82001.1 hypothetical protein BFR04_11900 [Gaetbulibacter sp. 4G1]